MTLSTDLIVLDPVDPEKTFFHGLDLLKRAVSFEPTWDEKEEGLYVTTCGQGLPAWLWVHYATDGPLRYYDDEDARWRVEYEPTWRVPEWNLHLIRVNVDTSYGYRTPSGARCSDLHAWFVSEMWTWFENQGVRRMLWQNEYTGEWFDSIDDVWKLGNPEKGAL